jgi:hypothetical protein
MLGDGSDVELIHGHLLLACLLAPVLRRRAQMLGFRVFGANIHGRRVEQQTLRQHRVLHRNGSEAFQLFRVDDREIQTRLRAVVQEDRVHDFTRRGRQAERDVRHAEDRLRTYGMFP